jgi:hypothetical protein
MELALSLEKLNYAKLKALDKLAVDAEDFNLADYVVRCARARCHVISCQHAHISA